MHMLASTLFRDVFAACGQYDQCYVRNDGLKYVDVVVTVEAWALSGRQESDILSFNFSLEGQSIGKTRRHYC
jgi:hypothetical protein